MRRLAVLAAAALGCGSNIVERTPGPLDRFFFPTGLGVLDHQLVVASSNADLTYDADAGGSVIAVTPHAEGCDPTVDPSCVDRVAGALDIRSFAGELAIADPAACPALADKGLGPAAVVPIRGTNVVYRLDLSAAGALSCAGCDIPVGASDRGDPWSVGVACDTTPTGMARAFVGYLRSSVGQSWITQIDLTRGPADDGYVQHAVPGDGGGGYVAGQVRSFAYDASRKRLYYTHTVTGTSATLGYIDLANGCRIDRAFTAGGCSAGRTPTGALPTGLEVEGIALATETDPNASVRRAYLTARIYDAAAAASTGARVGDFDGLLLVVELSEDATGVVNVQIVDQIPIGYGAAYVRVLPPRAGKRDVVVAIAADDGVVWIYDDDTGGRVAIGRDPATGAPLTGQGPFGLAVDPAPLAVAAGNVARVYVGSFREHFVTPIDVPLDDPSAAYIPLVASVPRRIGGGVTR